MGGFPQTSLFRSWHPKLADDLWMVGDSIFPGQSTAAVALGGLRVAQSVLHSMQAAPQNAIEYSQDTALTGEKFSETRAAY